jgi:hypothetical protein
MSGVGKRIDWLGWLALEQAGFGLRFGKAVIRLIHHTNPVSSVMKQMSKTSRQFLLLESAQGLSIIE